MAYEFETELEANPELEEECAGELEGEMEDEFEGEMEDEFEDEAGLEGEGWLGAIGNVVGSLLGEEEFEGEGEGEEELSPIRKIYPDAMMEHLGELAAEAETEDEAAEHFLPLIGMAASKLLPVVARAIAPAAKKMLPKIARAVTKAAPRLTKGIGTVARTLHRNPQTRHLLKTVPSIARRTVGTLAHRAARGHVVTPHAAVRTLAKHTRRVLGSPRHRAHALRHHYRLERGLHHRYGRGIAHRHGYYGHRRHRFGHLGHVAGGAVPRYATSGGIYRPGVRGRVMGARGIPHGGTTGGHCACPQYCRCCGQLLR